MKYLKRFNENISIYNPDWELFLPEEVIVYKGQEHGIDEWHYKKGNIMLNPDMVQISYYTNEWTAPDTFEIDIYLVQVDSERKPGDSTTVIKSGGVIDYDKNIGKKIKNLRLDVDITFGDEMACEFTIFKNRVSQFQHTSYGSKFDPSETLFAIDDNSLLKLVDFFNRFNNGIKLTIEDFEFLRNQ